jgi:EF hand domain-containing protein
MRGGGMVMWRFLAGVAAALLLVSGGIFWWTSSAGRQAAVPSAPKAVRLAAVEGDQPAEPPSASEKTREEKRFGRYDKDRDGIITRAEMMNTRQKGFEKLDTSRDGKLSFDEWAIETSKRFADADADRSGTLSSAEFATTKRPSSPKPRCNCSQESGD